MGWDARTLYVFALGSKLPHPDEGSVKAGLLEIATSKSLRPAKREQMACDGYHFVPLEGAHLPMIAGWLETPEVVRWWGDPQEQLALIAGDLADPRMRQWIVFFEEHPFAYVQAFEAQAWPQPHMRHMAPGTEAIDAFIGDPAMIGKGHGRAFLRSFARMLLGSGASGAVIDPDIGNLRAQRAYAAAGFVADGFIETEEGPCLLMHFSG